MNFISLEFVFFYPFVLLLYWIFPGKLRGLLLLTVSCFFYFSESSWAGILLLLTALVTYFAAQNIQNERRKKKWLAISLLFCLGLLIGFKYAVPPVGISFYTFQTLSYVIDVYRKQENAERNFGWYLLFVSFFPQLVAGPVERSGNLLPQLKKIQIFRKEDIEEGFWLMVRGFFKKIVVADQLAPYADRIFDAPTEINGIAAVLGTIFFAIQIYCDFSGYTDIARGSARMLGIHLMENFQYPYRAGNIQEFWHRWHISLTKWFTDYVYIPLGGSQKGFFRQCINIGVVFGLSGFWHGADWNYVIWGLLHGSFLTGYLLYRKYIPIRKTGLFRKAVSWGLTMLLVCIAWIFFRSSDIGSALEMINRIISEPFTGGIAAVCDSFQIMGGKEILKIFLVLFSFGLIEHIPDNIREKIKKPLHLAIGAIVIICMMTAIEFLWLSDMAEGIGNTFIYFRF